MARRLSAGSREGPLGTAQETRTPFISRRKSKWRWEARCFCTTKRKPGALETPSAGSGVELKLRLRLYSSSGIGIRTPAYLDSGRGARGIVVYILRSRR